MSNLIRDLAQDDRPREKLARLGPAALDNSELLALFLRTGIKGTSAIELGRQLLNLHGSLGALGRMDLATLTAERGLGIAKASQLIAAFELGSRVAKEQLVTAQLDSPETIYKYFSPQLSHLTHERLLVLLLDTRLRHMGTHLVSQGTVNETIAHPREILQPVIVKSAYAFALIHNHPSGDPSPSRADESLTQRIKDAAALLQLRFVDHIIIGRPQPGRDPWFSFRQAGLVG
jgi:DNA repair protein RadC